ncbi:hypothetical protein AB0I00_10700 [Streptomyces sp. NPDC050803]|uniref:hypothetical protein n=1 Tax=unclassified Streptomyces TaxID=2593676 RepID=UPI0034311A05
MWACSPADAAHSVSDCYALNVSRGTVWACPYTRFPLLEIGPGHSVRVRENPVRSGRGFRRARRPRRAVRAPRQGAPRLVDCRLTDSAVEPLSESRLVRPGGEALGRHRVVSRGARLYVQEEPATAWSVLDIG